MVGGRSDNVLALVVLAAAGGGEELFAGGVLSKGALLLAGGVVLPGAVFLGLSSNKMPEVGGVTTGGCGNSWLLFKSGAPEVGPGLLLSCNGVVTAGGVMDGGDITGGAVLSGFTTTSIGFFSSGFFSSLFFESAAGGDFANRSSARAGAAKGGAADEPAAGFGGVSTGSEAREFVAVSVFFESSLLAAGLVSVGFLSNAERSMGGGAFKGGGALFAGGDEVLLAPFPPARTTFEPVLPEPVLPLEAAGVAVFVLIGAVVSNGGG